ncbi:MAG: hypothetical protein WC155_11075, partial [Candidatus Cloacimonadales bacterium]
NSSSKYELVVQGKKIVGSAQVRKNNVLLQHGSIILTENQREIAYLMPDISDKMRAKLAQLMDNKTITINQVLKKTVAYEVAVGKFVQGFKKAWANDDFEDISDLEEFEKERVRDLIKNKYSTNMWNLRK